MFNGDMTNDPWLQYPKFWLLKSMLCPKKWSSSGPGHSAWQSRLVEVHGQTFPVFEQLIRLDAAMAHDGSQVDFSGPNSYNML